MLTKENLPQEWELKALSEVCNINPRKSEVKNYHNSEKVTFLSMESVGENGEIYSQEIKDLGEVFKGYTYFKKNDVLFAKITPCMENGKGTIAKIGTDIGFGSTEFHILRTHKEVIPEWVYRFLALQYTRKYAEQNMTGSAGQKRVPKTFFDKLKIPVPPLETQKKIVEILENAEKLKEWRVEADKLADNYLKSLFLEMFGHSGINPKNWPLMKAEEICLNEKNAIKAGPFGSSLKKEFYVEKGYKIYGQEQVIKDDFAFGDYYIPEKIYKKLENCKIKEGDVLISLVGSYGKISIVPKEFEPGIINPRLMKISLNQKIILPLFFKFLLNSEGIEKKIQQVSHGGTMDILNVKIIKQLDFPIPPIDIQKQFVDMVQQVETLKNHQSQSKQEIDNLFNTLMQKAFKGELVC